jgi:general secretion pathway protein D
MTINNLLVRRGVEFTAASGSNMAFDGSQLIVSNALQNLQRIERILQKHNQTQQVDIETKFLGVIQGVLDEFDFRWNLTNRFNSSYSQVNTGTPQGTTPAMDNRQTLSQAFAPSNSSRGDGQIVHDNNPEPIPINNQPPNLPGQINIGTASMPFRALEQKTDSDLMSAPKLTALSGKMANRVVAQELRYLQSYGETRSEVGTGSTIGDSTSAG